MFDVLISRSAAQVDVMGDAELVDRIARLERVKSAAAAAQARLTAELDRRRREESGGRPVRGVAEEVALARRESPTMGSRHLAVARALVHEMPHTMAALEAGDISEYRAYLMVKETAALSLEDRRAVDASLGPRLATMGNQETAAEVRRAGYELDPHALIRRTSRAEADRCVTLRPAPDAMTYLTGLLPVTQGVAVYAALRRHAETLRGTGDPRTLGQVMADTLVERVTGQTRAEAVPVEVHLVMTDASLVGADHTPADLLGAGPVPAWLARRAVRKADKAWIRRLYTRPTDAQLVATDTRRRLFTGVLRDLVIIRDKTCRTPWCDAPIRHADHVLPHSEGGPTSLDNAQGLCERCNHTKEAVRRSWQQRAGPRLDVVRRARLALAS